MTNVDDEELTVTEKTIEAVAELLSCTLAVNDVVPVPVGAPLIKPVVEFSVSPAGSAPAVIDQV
jgi:hypothetical protein